MDAIKIPSEEEELARLLSRGRSRLVDERVKIGHKIKSKLYQFGLIECDDERPMSLKWINELKENSFTYELKTIILTWVNVWLEINRQVEDLDKHLEKQAEQQKAMEDMYRSVAGVGPVTSRTLANELGDMQHFSSEKKLYSYTGLTPQEHSSGETRRLGHITRCGRSLIRKTLVEMAWRAIRIDGSLKEVFERIAKRAGKKRAIIAIARKMIGRIRACFASGELYKIQAI